jgi:hypothetical protein
MAIEGIWNLIMVGVEYDGEKEYVGLDSKHLSTRRRRKRTYLVLYCDKVPVEFRQIRSESLDKMGPPPSSVCARS